MSKVINLKRGLDIRLVGEAARKTTGLPRAAEYAVSPLDYDGVTPKLLVKAGDEVRAGSPLFFDKSRPELMFCSPVAGTVREVVRGEKRRILSVIVASAAEDSWEDFGRVSPDASREQLVALMLRSGLWPLVAQRPYGIIASPADTPKAVFISGFDSAPLAADMDYVLADRRDDLQTGIRVMAKLTSGRVHIGLREGQDGVTSKLEGCEKHRFRGPHPAGNVGVQISHVDPVSKGDVIWTVDVQNLAVIGRFFRTGRVDMTKTIALAGAEIENPHYVTVKAGAPMEQITAAGRIRPQAEGDGVRIIDGNVLTGIRREPSGYFGPYNNMVTVIPEGDKYEFLGWAMPRFDKFSVSRSYFSWLTPGRRYDLDTNLHGGERPLVLSGLYSKYLPMDIFPLYLLKATIAGDIDKMEQLGIYEVIPEDVALCEFVDPSKTEWQEIIRNGIELMIKEN